MAAADASFWLIPLLVAGTCGISCPLLGTLLVLQKRIPATNVMAYAVLPGVVLAEALRLPPLLGGVASSLAAVLLAEALIALRGEGDGDGEGGGSAEAVLNSVLAGSLGLGVLLVQSLAVPVNLQGLLFGDLLVATPADLLRQALVLALLLALIAWNARPWQWLGLDPEGAKSLELPVRRLRVLMAALTAVVVVSATAAVGLALVMALICAPSLAALAGATSLAQALRRAALLGLATSLLGCALALLSDLPPGPLMACCCLPLLLVRGGRGQRG
jgi:zinc/manganese transport system permease protein